ncbi:uncharacterized protein LOC132759780 isoform X2 [Ruditapes philippinarum]|uniref:uncharacterized protein LOC132759780 isoform X2 n=1 Tax=Ruditapes philippinarum TaxID=129788 RepID=UPI00295B0790|nr:uncharacterized protein LOC132759780 isoform X2 [Ruditapes philippinarum]
MGVAFNGTVLTEETAKLILRGGLTNPTQRVPAAPKRLYSKVKDGKLVIAWLANPRVLYGLEYLEHIMMKVVHYYSSPKTYRHTEYILFNVTGVTSTTKFEYNCTEIRPGTFEIYSTLWFLGNLVHSNDSHLTSAAVDDSSRSDVLFIPRQNLVPDLIETKAVTESCICKSTISIKVFASGANVTAIIQAWGLPVDTPVEIQLIQNAEIKIILKSVNISGRDIQKPYIKTFNSERGESYFVRVLRHCPRKYKGILTCGKDEADVMKSDNVSIKKGSYYSTWKSSTVETFEGIDSQLVLQIAAITFTLGFSITLYLALMIKLLTGKYCPKRKSSNALKRSTYVRLNSKGAISTKLTSSKRVAIIFTKDSPKHEENVARINDELTQRGINSVMFDETSSPEIMANWGQAAENVVTDFEVVMFIISPLLYRICKKEGILSTTFEERNEETNESGAYTPILTRFPAAVLSTLKARKTWADTNKTICVSLCVAETKEEYKRLSLKMRQEHPLVFKDKIYFHNLRNDNSKSNRKLIHKIIRALKH